MSNNERARLTPEQIEAQLAEAEIELDATQAAIAAAIARKVRLFVDLDEVAAADGGDPRGPRINTLNFN